MQMLPSTETQPSPAGCADGLVVVPTEDGPERVACTCRACTSPETWAPPRALLEAIPDDEPW